MATESTESTDPNPTPKTFFPFTPILSGEGGNTASGAGLRGSVVSVVSVAHPGWRGRVENRLFNHLPRNSRKNLIFFVMIRATMDILEECRIPREGKEK